MADVIDQAVTDRERPLRDDVVVPFRTGYLRLRAEETQRIVRSAQRRFRRHNAARRWVEGEIWSSMAATWRDGDRDRRTRCRDAVRSMPEIREALERMWPVLTPGAVAARPVRQQGAVEARRGEAPHRGTSTWRCTARGSTMSPRCAGPTTTSPLLDEARSYLGPKPTSATAVARDGPRTPTRSAPTATSWSTRCRTSRRCSCGWCRAAR